MMMGSHRPTRPQGDKVRRRIEDVIEENGDERLPHEDFYAGVVHGDYDQRQPFVVSTTTSLPAGGSNTASIPQRYFAMAVVPGPYVRGCLDTVCFALAFATLIIQLGLIDYYFISNLQETVWYTWIAADIFVILVFICVIIATFKYNQEHMQEACAEDGKVKFAFIVWLVYALVLVAKIVGCYHFFYHQLPPTPIDNNDKLFDDHLLKLTLSLSVLVFIFMLEALHYTPLASARQLYITYLATAICLDLLDTISFLDLIWQDWVYKWSLQTWLRLVILGIACFNFVLPAFALLKLRFRRSQRVLLVSEKVWAFIYVLVMNGPLLGLRIYLYILLEVQLKGHRYDASLFMVKNVAMIYLALREVWIRLQYWRQKRGALGSRGELTAPGATEHDDN